MTMNKTGVLIINLGTPDSYRVNDVRKYLREFLIDDRVIDIPFISRWLLVNLIIAPFRAPRSARVYQKLWTEDGSPLMHYGRETERKLQKRLGKDFIVKLAMRYQNPGIDEVLNEFNTCSLSSLVILPLFPQYASATTGSVNQRVMSVISHWQSFPELKFSGSYYDHPLFIQAFAERAQKKLSGKNFDHMIFSYHGLPERQVLKASCNSYCRLNECCSNINDFNRQCYRAQCFQTSRLLAKALKLDESAYSTVFQSRLGNKPWIQPYAESIIRKLVSEGKKKIAIMVPSFVSDCLETTIEVGQEFRDVFLNAGGEEWIFIESLNDSNAWIKCLAELVLKA